MTHDYKPECQCYRCKGIRNNPFSPRVVAMQRKARAKNPKKFASREEQHGRYLDCGPQNWDE